MFRIIEILNLSTCLKQNVPQMWNHKEKIFFVRLKITVLFQLF